MFDGFQTPAAERAEAQRGGRRPTDDSAVQPSGAVVASAPGNVSEKPVFTQPRAPRLLDQVRAAIRVHGYSRRTEKAYVAWIRRFVRFHGIRHPRELEAGEVSAFLTYLAVERNVSASTQNQALSAILFLYREVLKIELGWLDDLVRARRPSRLPVVLTRSEVTGVLDRLNGTPWLMASLLYGAGLRVLECARLRVKDVDLDRREIVVRDGKGMKDRVTLLPESLRAPLGEHVERMRRQHQRDLARGLGSVELPTAIERKHPRAPWQ
ncbi:MAG: integron integrase, partial [Gemmatimonadota bacterium]